MEGNWFSYVSRLLSTLTYFLSVCFHPRLPFLHILFPSSPSHSLSLPSFELLLSFLSTVLPFLCLSHPLFFPFTVLLPSHCPPSCPLPSLSTVPVHYFPSTVLSVLCLTCPLTFPSTVLASCIPVALTNLLYCSQLVRSIH